MSWNEFSGISSAFIACLSTNTTVRPVNKCQFLIRSSIIHSTLPPLHLYKVKAGRCLLLQHMSVLNK